MKPVISIFIVFPTLVIFACAPLQNSQPGLTAVPVTLPAITQPAVEATSPGSSGSGFPANGVTLSENGMTFVMQPDESFLLNLGMDIYDWTVEVDNQNVIHRELNVMVIRGAQGIYIAQNPGTAILTASGDPLCFKSNPPCMMPSILFSITLIVE